jgi:hypothetical protein
MKWIAPRSKQAKAVWFVGCAILMVAVSHASSPWWVAILAGVAWAVTVDRYDLQTRKEEHDGSAREG